jgi:hypothetical protein
MTGALKEPLRSLKTARLSHIAGHKLQAAASTASAANCAGCCAEEIDPLRPSFKTFMLFKRMIETQRTTRMQNEKGKMQN